MNDPDRRVLRDDFPLLARSSHGKPLVYLDSAATSQKPQLVLDTLDRCYRLHNANVHRGVYELAAEATDLYEAAREKTARFLGAPSGQQIVFTRGTTESLNLVAFGYAMPRLQPGDEIVTTLAEHHSNLVPWQQVAKRTGARLTFLPLLPDGTLDLEAAEKKINPRTKLVTIAHVSNVLGTVHPIRRLADLAHRVGAALVVDAAQSVPQRLVDVMALDCDFLAFSGHKAYGPTGVGVLYGKREMLQRTDPLLFGGEMIDRVELTDSTWKDAPWKLEAGTPPILQAIGLGAALDYLSGIGMDRIHRAVQDLTRYAYVSLADLEGISLYGPGPGTERGDLLTFNLGDIHPHDIATVLDSEGIAVRAGHHCCQQAMRWLGVPATVRASFALYNTRADVDRLVDGLRKAKELFQA
ncbi:cysteine desulfurase [Tumebacillus sp. DT12]|uniref:Cysteine desulfurase n=1 Tax=Tumebacillus lacus TaxID=2995335 RepID=A0ABT3X5Q5_9BACL|nr:cysteine desulfurase [Tumebacillus lacus]MCX7570049.1 cysteine desulfurase [Tumebacillus lacus]